MKLNTLKPAVGSKKVARRVGRGIGSGLGKTAGRGHKGAARALHAQALAAKVVAVAPAHRVLRVARVLELDERKAGRAAGDPHAAQAAEAAELGMGVRTA